MALAALCVEAHCNHMGVISGISPLSDYDTVYVRLALAAGFLGAVSDRLGLWGPYGTANVAWGDMQHFLTYAAKLNPWFPQGIIPFVGATVTIVESTLGIGLLLGFQTRRAAQLSGWLGLAFGIGMTVGTGFKSALNASVFAFSGGAWLLARARDYPMSVDALRSTWAAGSTASGRRATRGER
jgi:putative oxidoreductase